VTAKRKRLRDGVTLTTASKMTVHSQGEGNKLVLCAEMQSM